MYVCYTSYSCSSKMVVSVMKINNSFISGVIPIAKHEFASLLCIVKRNIDNITKTFFHQNTSFTFFYEFCLSQYECVIMLKCTVLSLFSVILCLNIPLFSTLFSIQLFISIIKIFAYWKKMYFKIMHNIFSVDQIIHI